MIQIPDPPTVSACTTCMSAISWCWSARNSTWFSVVRVGEDTMRIHDCNLPGAPSGWPTWRTVPKGSPPNETYRQARAALSTPPDTDKITDKETT